MKKLFLLLAAGSIAMNVGAQERKSIVVDGPQKLNFEKGPIEVGQASLKNSKYLANKTAGAAKTTAPTERWYNYSVYLNQKVNFDRTVTGTGTFFLDFYGPNMWNDTVNMITYVNGSTYTKSHTRLVSLGTVLRPQFPGFNRTDLFGSGIMKIRNSDAYSMDSVSLSYWYTQGTKGAAGHTDTVRLAFLVGDGSSTKSIFGGGTAPGGHYVIGTKFPDVAYDSVLNVAVGKSTGVPAIYQDVLFAHNSDTSVFGKTKSIKLATSVPAAAGDFISVIMSYKSGDPAPSLKTLPGDTLAGVGGRYYDMFQPFVDYVTTDDPTTVTNTNPSWLDYDSTDLNVGLYKQLPNTDPGGWKNQYIPNWAWSSSGTPSGAFYYGYADIGYHLVCPTCIGVTDEVKTTSSVNSINAVPNPANNQVSINFSLVSATDVTVSLTNVVGQVVATQNINNTSNGKATFNTTALPAGVYVYTLIANGEKNTGRVVVAH